MAELALTSFPREKAGSYFSFAGGGSIPALDGLRALAILLVLFRHVARPFWSPEDGLLPVGGWDLAVPMMNGWAGVDLFFVLSGFLITHQILGRYRREDGRIAYGAYIGRRALRIVPAYYATLLILAAGLIPFYPAPTEDLAMRLGWHLLFLQDYLPQTFAPVFWSLGVEEKFYLLAPLLLWAVLRVERVRLQYFLLGGLILLPAAFRALVLWADPAPIDYAEFFLRFRSPFHLSFDGLAMGCLCALVYRDRARWAWVAKERLLDILFWAGAGLFVLLLAQGPLLDRIDRFDELALQSLLAVAGGAMLLPLALGRGPVRWFAAPALRILARLAYALYLVHYPIIGCVMGALDTTGWYPALPAALKFLALLPLYLAAAAAAALVLHFAIEKPFLLLREPHRVGRAAAPRSAA